MSSPLDIFAVPSSFTTFPARIHGEEEAILQNVMGIVQKFGKLLPDINGHNIAVGPYGNYFAMAFPEGEIDRVRVSAEILTALWIYDDIAESVTDSEALQCHFKLKDILSSPGDIESDEKEGIAQIFAALVRGMTKEYAKDGAVIIHQLQRYLTEYDDTPALNVIDSYLAFRVVNFGFPLLDGLVKWCMHIQFDDAENETAKDYYDAAARVMALTNDYFSWDVEKANSESRYRNAIPVVMKQLSLTEKDAKLYVKGMIVDAEQACRSAGVNLRKAHDSENIKSYVKAMSFYLGGSGFWCSTCPRYHAPVQWCTERFIHECRLLLRDMS